MRNELRKLDAQLEMLHARQTELEAALSDSSLYQAEQKDRQQKLLTERAALDRQLASTEERWLEVSEEIEQAQADSGSLS